MKEEQKPDWITQEEWNAVPSIAWWEDNRVKKEYIKQSKPVTIEEAKAQFARLRKEENWNQTRYNFFDNLYQNKIIYRERFVMIVSLENLIITDTYFQATAYREHFILKKRQQKQLSLRKNDFLKQWDFKGSWDWAIYSKKEQSISMPYAGFTIWTNPGLVKYIEGLVLDGAYNEALDVLYRRNLYADNN